MEEVDKGCLLMFYDIRWLHWSDVSKVTSKVAPTSTNNRLQGMVSRNVFEYAVICAITGVRAVAGNASCCKTAWQQGR